MHEQCTQYIYILTIHIRHTYIHAQAMHMERSVVGSYLMLTVD